MTIGGTAAGAGNVIAYNTTDGVRSSISSGSAAGNAVSGNSIYSNGNLAIDIANDGVTNNDAGDGDTGPNARQNFPVLTAAVTNGTQAFIGGTLNSTASRSYRIEFFASTAGPPIRPATARGNAISASPRLPPTARATPRSRAF